MTAKVTNIPEQTKKFIPAQVRLHDAGINILCSMQNIVFKMQELKTQIAGIDADLDIMHEYYLEKQLDSRAALAGAHNRWLIVYQHKLSHYKNTLLRINDGAIGHSIERIPTTQPAALKNGKTA